MSGTAVDLGHMYGDSGEPGHTRLDHCVLERLPADYVVTDRDLRWLDECDGFYRFFGGFYCEPTHPLPG